MAEEAEQQKAEDEVKAKMIDAKNKLEAYCFQIKNTLDDEKLKTHFTDDDKKVIEDTSAEGIQWLKENENSDVDAINRKYRELEAKYDPIMTRVNEAWRSSKKRSRPTGDEEEFEGENGDDKRQKTDTESGGAFQN